MHSNITNLGTCPRGFIQVSLLEHTSNVNCTSDISPSNSSCSSSSSSSALRDGVLALLARGVRFAAGSVSRVSTVSRASTFHEIRRKIVVSSDGRISTRTCTHTHTHIHSYCGKQGNIIGWVISTCYLLCGRGGSFPRGTTCRRRHLSMR
jgi:hypothetical protein